MLKGRQSMQTKENALELALMLAATEPAHRPEFYRLLLESTVYVPGSSDQIDEGQVTLKAGAKVALTNWLKPDGSHVIPFFSSLAALQRAIESDEHYIALPAKTFFEMTRGSELILNPRSEYGKEFTPWEVEALLAEGVNRLPTQRVVKKDTEVLLGQPSNYPAVMVASLATLLARHSNVKAAYLALMFDSTVDEKPHLIVGIEGEGDFENVLREVGSVAGDLAPEGEPVDLIRVVRGEAGVGKYFIEAVKPFYKRD
jgi:SseB protein C-terminal domain/SseB protein N-terminal domain